MASVIALPRLMRIGAGASGELAATLESLGLSRPFIVTDRFLEQTGRLAALTDGLDAAGVRWAAFSDTVPDPTLASVAAAREALGRGDHDCVVGFGGGMVRVSS